jgi:hypothetical protein
MRCGGGGGLSHVQITPTWWRLTLAAALLLQRHGARGWRLLIMAFSTLGIVYGDIGGNALAAAVCARRRCCKARCPTTASWSLAPGPCSLAGTLPRQHSCLSPPLLPLPLVLAAKTCVSLQAPPPSMFLPPSSPMALPPTATSCWVLPPPSFGASPPLVGAPAWVLASRGRLCCGAVGWACHMAGPHLAWWDQRPGASRRPPGRPSDWLEAAAAASAQLLTAGMQRSAPLPAAPARAWRCPQRAGTPQRHLAPTSRTRLLRHLASTHLPPAYHFLCLQCWSSTCCSPCLQTTTARVSQSVSQSVSV